MPKIAYVAERNFGAAKRALIARANTIIAEYQAQGFDLTLRQLYYQFVARGLIANRQTEYKRLGDVINDGRMAGLIDWLAIVDRTRYVRDISHWSEPSDIIESAAASFRIDKWANQRTRIEVWVEKDALVGVMERACVPLDVPFLACRGYTSQSEMWLAAQRLLKYVARGQKVRILHFGDHDPSGMDMSRDIEDRIRLFMGRHASQFGFTRLALNTSQITQYNPPPNPAKTTDSRFRGYMLEFGEESWELDALDPNVLVNLVTTNVIRLREDDKWQEMVAREEDARARLRVAAADWSEIADNLDEDRVREEVATATHQNGTEPEEDEEGGTEEIDPEDLFACADCGQPGRKIRDANGHVTEVVHVSDADHEARYRS